MAFNPNYQNRSQGGRGGYYNQNQGGGGGGYNNNYSQGGGGGGRYQGGGGGGGGYNQQGNSRGGYGGGGGGQQQGFKRGRDDDQQGGNGGYQRRRSDQTGNFSSPRRDGRSNNSQGATTTYSQRFKDDVWGLGNASDYDPILDIPAVARVVQDQFQRDKSLVFSTFRVAITELPYKLLHYAALISLLSNDAQADSKSRSAKPDKRPPAEVKPLPESAVVPAEKEGDAEKDVDMATPAAVAEDAMPVEVEAVEVAPPAINIGREILEDLLQAVQFYLDERKWRNVRYCILLFSHLAALPSPLVSPPSLATFLTSFLSVLSEPSLRASRGDECVRIIVEAILRLGPTAASKAGTTTLKEGVLAYLTQRRIEKELFGEGEIGGQYEDYIEVLISTLSSDTPLTLDIFPSIESLLPRPASIPDNENNNDDEPKEEKSTFEPIVLPIFVIPEDLDDTDARKIVTPPATSAGLRGDEGVGYEGVRLYLKFFDDDSVPAPYDPSGTVLRSLIFDMVDLYEVNRKECAKILLELPQWVTSGTFKPRNSEELASEDDEQRKDWLLENLVVESILASLLSLPSPKLPSAYYHSVLTELCRLSPQTVAPSLGKCVRKLYAGLGADVDDRFPVLEAEGVRRFAEWFATHLSNFGFMWGWADWVVDMDLDTKHPKRVFVKRTIELEVRLSYYDRVKGTIPEAMLHTGVMDDDAPGPEYAYEAEEHPHSAPAASLLRLMRSKGSITEVEAELEAFQSSLQKESNLPLEEADAIKRDMVIQTILSVGSRSFSHFLNVLERYLPLLRSLCSSHHTRSDLLNTVSTFWSRNSQFHLIVLDKLLQYRLVEASDIVSWIFREKKDATKWDWSNVDTWTALITVVRTLESRVDAVKIKVENAKEDLARRLIEIEGIVPPPEKEKAEEVDPSAIVIDAAPLPNATYEQDELASAQSALTATHADLAAALIESIRQFSLLLPIDADKDGWDTVWVEGWFRELCRHMAQNKLLALAPVLEGIESLKLDPKSSVVAILDSAKTWSEFV